jgi:hypothetical protein
MSKDGNSFMRALLEGFWGVMGWCAGMLWQDGGRRAKEAIGRQPSPRTRHGTSEMPSLFHYRCLLICCV